MEEILTTIFSSSNLLAGKTAIIVLFLILLIKIVDKKTSLLKIIGFSNGDKTTIKNEQPASTASREIAILPKLLPGVCPGHQTLTDKVTENLIISEGLKKDIQIINENDKTLSRIIDKLDEGMINLSRNVNIIMDAMNISKYSPNRPNNG